MQYVNPGHKLPVQLSSKLCVWVERKGRSDLTTCHHLHLPYAFQGHGEVTVALERIKIFSPPFHHLALLSAINSLKTIKFSYCKSFRDYAHLNKIHTNKIHLSCILTVMVLPSRLHRKSRNVFLKSTKVLPECGEAKLQSRVLCLTCIIVCLAY